MILSKSGQLPEPQGTAICTSVESESSQPLLDRATMQFESLDSTLIKGELETPPLEEGINSSKGTVSSSLDVQMPIPANKLNKLDIPIIRYELVPDELTFTHEDENENPSWVPVEPEFNNDCSVVVSNFAEQLDTSSTAEELDPDDLTLTNEGETENSSRVLVEPEFNNCRSAVMSDDAEKLNTSLTTEEWAHDLLKQRCRELGVIIRKSELHAKAKKVCLVCMPEGGSKTGPFEKVVLHFSSQSEARNIKNVVDRFLKAKAVSAVANQKGKKEKNSH